MAKYCEICGTAITDENQSDVFEYGCMGCDRVQYELQEKGYQEDMTDYYEERLIEERRAV